VNGPGSSPRRSVDPAATLLDMMSWVRERPMTPDGGVFKWAPICQRMRESGFQKFADSELVCLTVDFTSNWNRGISRPLGDFRPLRTGPSSHCAIALAMHHVPPRFVRPDTGRDANEKCDHATCSRRKPQKGNQRSKQHRSRDQRTWKRARWLRAPRSQS